MNAIEEQHVDTGTPPVAAGILRGVARTLMAADYAVLSELTLANDRRADLAAMDRRGQIAIVEIKSCLADFRADHKWQDYLDYCDLFYFAVTDDFPSNVLPEDEGLMIADTFGAEIVRLARQRMLSAARRKAMSIRFARVAAGRLQRAIDPQI